jgi:hypothetical protein
MVTEQERAYAAGIFDGEGTIDIQDRARMAVKMTDKGPIDALQDILGGRVYQWKDTKTGRGVYEWRASGSDGMLSAIRDISPYAVGKARQLEVARSFYTYRTDWGYEAEVRAIASRQLRGLREPSPACVTFDLETMGLDPINLPMLSATFMPDSNESNVVSLFKMASDEEDHQVAILTRDYLEAYAYSLGWNSSRFDIQYLNTRLLMWKERPVFLGSHTDVDVEFDKKFKNSKRTSLVNAVNQLKLADETVHKTPIDWPKWYAAYDGDMEAMEYIVEHAQMDVILTKRVWDAIQ